jgi:hypothetical protein
VLQLGLLHAVSLAINDTSVCNVLLNELWHHAYHRTCQHRQMHIMPSSDLNNGQQTATECPISRFPLGKQVLRTVYGPSSDS